MGRWTIAERIAALDPERDHVEIYRLSTGHEFPWDYRRGLEIALLRTFAVPSIAELLSATGEFARRPQRRYDDTAILMGELAAHGYDSPRGRLALRRINRAHAHYRIANEDMLFVLSTFVLDPARWIDRYGWRRLLPQERHAAFAFYREVGRRLGIRDLPDDLHSLARLHREHSRRMRPTDASRALGRDVLGLVTARLPRPVQVPARQLVPAVLDADIAEGLGLPEAPGWSRAAADRVLRGRAVVVRRLPARRRPAFEDGSVRFRSYPGYPEGHDLADIGAPDPPRHLDRALLADRVRRRGSG